MTEREIQAVAATLAKMENIPLAEADRRVREALARGETSVDVALLRGDPLGPQRRAQGRGERRAEA